MNNYIQLFIFVIIIILIFWLLYYLYQKAIKLLQVGAQEPAKNLSNDDEEGEEDENDKGAKKNKVKPRSCPICSTELLGIDQVQTTAFPALGSRKDRLMYIRGCINCIAGDQKRVCPVCDAEIPIDGYLISRMFDGLKRRAHVHVVGCSQCNRLRYNK